MPDKLHGISDPEIRQRQRYADLIAGSLKIDMDNDADAGGEGHAGGQGGARELSTREVFERRSKIIREMRAFLDERGYIEVETPMLTPIASGAAARPFKTHHNALGIDLYARIAPELYLKRLLVGGFERVYELNRNFRNEGISTRHNPEFTMLEFYCAYMDVNGMMDLCEELLRQSAIKATGETMFRFGDQEIDFTRFDRFTMKEAIDNNWPAIWRNLSHNNYERTWLDEAETIFQLYWFLIQRHLEVAKAASDNVLDASREMNFTQIDEKAWKMALNEPSGLSELSEEERSARLARYILFIFEEVAEPNLMRPTFIYDYPKPISPLSKASADDPSVAERFELFINGMECANGFSELNDPLEQYERFKEQAGARERGDEEAMQMDTDYVRALSYGMPPAAGIGIGIDRIVMLLTNRRSIRDVILFPHMRPAAASKPEEEAAARDEHSALPIEQAEANNEQVEATDVSGLKKKRERGSDL
jgi:lysyl-tRNA synthetase class 2